MDWSKAKNILIALFLMLDLFLLASILFTYSSSRMTPDYALAAQKILQERNIRIECKIPNPPENVGRIAYEEGAPVFLAEPSFHLEVDAAGYPILVELRDRAVSDDAVEAAASEVIAGDWITAMEASALLPVDRDSSFSLALVEEGPTLTGLDSDQTTQVLLDWFNEIGMKSHALAAQGRKNTDAGTVISFAQEYKNGTLFDNRLDVILLDGRIVRLEGRLRTVKREVGSFVAISIQQLLIMNSWPENSVVTDIRFGWRSTDEGVLHDGLVWRVTLNGADVHDYDALTGEEIGMPGIVAPVAP